MTQICSQLRDQTHQGKVGGPGRNVAGMHRNGLAYRIPLPRHRSHRVMQSRPPLNGNGTCHPSVVNAQMITTDLVAALEL